MFNSVSIIVTIEEQQSQLRQLLPRLLSLRYGGEYEVIVVDKKHDKDLEEWLDEMEACHPNLCHTFCPASARGIDLHKLAVTLGAKAANYEWLVILPVETNLPNEEWLANIMADIDDQADSVVCDIKRRYRHAWLWNIFRRKFTVFRSSSSIIICRRSVALQPSNNNSPDNKIIKYIIVK